MNFNKKNDDEKPILGKDPFTKKTSLFPSNNLKKGSSFLERLKNLSKKDIVTVALGLTVLVTIPVAEFFMSKPDSDNLLKPGFGERKSSDSVGPNLYDNGVNALSAGSPDGSSEVIVPLTARDPMSLLVGEKSSEAPMPSSIPPQTSLRDSMKDIGTSAFSQAAQSSLAPFIPNKMSVTLRGMSSFFEGGGSKVGERSIGGSNILASAKNSSKATEKRSMAGPVAIPGYKGVASNTLNTSSKDALDKLRSKADKAANFFSGESAVKSLNDAASVSLNDKGSSTGGLGGISDGAKNSSPSGSNLRDSKSSNFHRYDPCKEGSLADQLACEEARANAQFWRELKQGLITSAIDSIIKKGLFEPIGAKIAGVTDDLLNPRPPSKPVGYCKMQDGSVTAIWSAGKNKDGNLIFSPFSPADCTTMGGQFTTNNPSGSTGGSAGGSTGAGNNGSGTGNNNGLASNPEFSKSKIEEYDSYLYTAMENSAKGKEESTKLGELLEINKAVGENLSKCSSLGSEISITNKSKSVQDINKELNNYRNIVASAQTEYSFTNQKFSDFVEKVNKALEGINNGTVKSKIDIKGVKAEVEKIGGDTSLAQIFEAKKKEAETNKTYLEKAGKEIEFHNGAINFYAMQIELISSKSDNTSSIYNQNAQNIQAVLSKLPSSVDDNTPLEQKKAITQVYKELTGEEPAIKIDLPNQQVASVNLKNYRSAPSDNITPLATAVQYRGADESKVFIEGKVNDAKVKEEEKTYYESISPLKKYYLGQTIDPSSGKELSENIIVPAIRGTMEVPEDIKKSTALVSNILSDLSTFNNKIDDWKKAIKERTGIDLDSLTPTTTPTTTTPTTTTPTTTTPTTTTPTTTTPTTTTPTTTTPTTTTPTTTTPNSNTSFKPESYISSANNYINSMKTSLNTADMAYKEVSSKCKNTECRKELNKAVSNLGKMRNYLAQAELLKKQIASCKNKSCAESKIRELKSIQTKFNNELKNFNINLDNARKKLGNNQDNNDENKPCASTEKGCKEVSSIYLVQKWTIRKPGTLGIVYTDTFSGAEGRTWDQTYSKYKNKEVTTSERNSICETEWSWKENWGNNLTQFVNLSDIKNGKKNCKEKWFTPVYQIGYSKQGTIGSGNDIVRINASRTSGSSQTKFKAFKGSGQNLFNSDVEILCSYSNNKWLIKEVNLKVDRPVAYTKSTNFNFSAGPSWIKVGAGIMVGTTTNIPYGTWKKMSVSNALCGSDIDAIDK